MPMNFPGGLSPAGASLGLGLDLQDQVMGEFEDERKKRLAQLQQQRLLGVTGSSAASALFGGLGGVLGGGLR